VLTWESRLPYAYCSAVGAGKNTRSQCAYKFKNSLAVPAHCGPASPATAVMWSNCTVGVEGDRSTVSLCGSDGVAAPVCRERVQGEGKSAHCAGHPVLSRIFQTTLCHGLFSLLHQKCKLLRVFCFSQRRHCLRAHHFTTSLAPLFLCNSFIAKLIPRCIHLEYP
jgi:hypothetical protein